MNDDKLEDLEGLDGSEPINPEQKLSELGVRRSDEIASNTQHRKTPRRNGKGVNKNLVKQPATPTDTIPQSAGLAVANAATSEFSAEDFGGEKLFAGRRIIDFLKVAKPFAILSAILTILGLVAILTKGLNLGLDFTGGVSATVVYEQPVQQAQVQSALASHKINDSVVQYLGSNKEILVRLPPQKQIEGLSNSLDAALDLPNNNATIKNIDVVGSQVGNEIYVSSLGATALALLCMFIYVMVRFQAKLALGAVLALFHDSIITVGIFAIFGWPFDLTVLAAVLALIGYSLNDSIVVSDRIRENFRKIRGAEPIEVIDISLTETLRRTIMTVATLLLVVLAMLFLGGDGLFWFAVAMLVGLFVGTYSSIYIGTAYALWRGLNRQDFVVQVKPEFDEENVM